MPCLAPGTSQLVTYGCRMSPSRASVTGLGSKCMEESSKPRATLSWLWPYGPGTNNNDGAFPSRAHGGPPFCHTDLCEPAFGKVAWKKGRFPWAQSEGGEQEGSGWRKGWLFIFWRRLLLSSYFIQNTQCDLHSPACE